MALFDDILNKNATAPQTKGDDKTTEQLIEDEFQRLMADRDFLDMRFHWYSLDQKQRDFYRPHIHGQAEANILEPIRKANEEQQRIKHQADKIKYIGKYDTRLLMLYLDGKRASIGAGLSIDCPHCKKTMALPTTYLGDAMWKNHLEILGGLGQVLIGLIVYKRGMNSVECEHCKKHTQINIVAIP